MSPELSPLGENGDPAALADGPFVVEVTDQDGTVSSLGFQLSQADERGITWLGTTPHQVAPAAAPEENGSTISFHEAGTGVSYLIRPLDGGDGIVAGAPDFPSDPGNRQAAQALAQIAWDTFYGEPLATEIGENNLYVTRSQQGKPLALIKLLSSSPALVRDNGAWRPLGENEDDLLGAADSPARDGAVLAWDAGDMRGLSRWITDDRFSPQDATELWAELDDSNHVTRVLLRRSRNRVYSRQDGSWVLATPNPDATTVDLLWSAISAWDDGDLEQLAQVQDYDAEGEAA